MHRCAFQTIIWPVYFARVVDSNHSSTAALPTVSYSSLIRTQLWHWSQWPMHCDAPVIASNWTDFIFMIYFTNRVVLIATLTFFFYAEIFKKAKIMHLKLFWPNVPWSLVDLQYFPHWPESCCTTRFWPVKFVTAAGVNRDRPYLSHAIENMTRPHDEDMSQHSINWLKLSTVNYGKLM